MFKTVEDKVLYVETLTSIATSGEKITDSSKILVYNILQNYGLPQEYADRIWKKIRQKAGLAEILLPIKDKEQEFKLLLVQELVMLHLANGRYNQEKKKLIEICTFLNINIKLENIKEYVQGMLKERENKLKKN